MILFFLRLLSRSLNCLPQRCVLGIGNVIGFFWYWVVPFRKRVVIQNLQLAFGDKQSVQEINRLALRNFQHYGKAGLEMIQSFTWTQEDFRKRTKLDGIENIEQFYSKGRGGFALTCHLGNWEISIGTAASRGVPLDIVVKKAKNAFAQKCLQRYRAVLGANFIYETGTAKDILRAIANGRFVGFVIDQFMGPPIGLPVKFFGHQAGTAVALALLTEKRDFSIVPSYAYRDDNGILHTVFEKPVQLPPMPASKEERLFEKTQAYNDILEAMIKKHPEQWLWLHRRWKPYKGSPRWTVASAFAKAVCVLMLLSCTSKIPAPATAIEIPPDPVVEAPLFVDSQTPVMITETPAPTIAKTEEAKKKAVSKRKAKITTPVFEVVPADQIPFEIGERQEIALNWNVVPLEAGRAILEVRKGDDFKGRKTFHLWGSVLSSRIVDTIYHIDNIAESIVDATGLIPYKFLLHMVETHQRKETRVMFDHRAKKAHYWSKRESERWGNELQDRKDDLVPQAKDMFSTIFFLRTLNYPLKKTQSFYVYENNKNIEVEFTNVANEVVQTKAGVFQCIKLKVAVKVENVLKPTGETYLWLSDDGKRYVVKFDAKIKVGSLIGTLVDVKDRSS